MYNWLISRRGVLYLLFSFCTLIVLLSVENVTGQEFPWPMFLPAITGANETQVILPPLVGTCTNGAQTVEWKGRTWQRCDDGKFYTYNQSVTYCDNLNLGGFTDWYMPRLSPLKDLVVCDNGHPVPLPYGKNCGSDGYGINFSAPTIDSSFECSKDYYWAGEFVPMAPNQYWIVNFGMGDDFQYLPSNTAKIRCVRGTGGAGARW